MNILISLIVIITSQHMYTSHHPITHFKHTIFICQSYLTKTGGGWGGVGQRTSCVGQKRNSVKAQRKRGKWRNKQRRYRSYSSLLSQTVFVVWLTKAAPCVTNESPKAFGGLCSQPFWWPVSTQWIGLSLQSSKVDLYSADSLRLTLGLRTRERGLALATRPPPGQNRTTWTAEASGEGRSGNEDFAGSPAPPLAASVTLEKFLKSISLGVLLRENGHTNISTSGLFWLN